MKRISIHGFRMIYEFINILRCSFKLPSFYIALMSSLIFPSIMRYSLNTKVGYRYSLIFIVFFVLLILIYLYYAFDLSKKILNINLNFKKYLIQCFKHIGKLFLIYLLLFVVSAVFIFMFKPSSLISNRIYVLISYILYFFGAFGFSLIVINESSEHSIQIAFKNFISSYAIITMLMIVIIIVSGCLYSLLRSNVKSFIPADIFSMIQSMFIPLSFLFLTKYARHCNMFDEENK